MGVIVKPRYGLVVGGHSKYKTRKPDVEMHFPTVYVVEGNNGESYA